MSPISWHYCEAANDFYHLLAHLDLGRDAANLYIPGLGDTDWAESLVQAYRTEPNREWAQMLALLLPEPALARESERDEIAWLCRRHFPNEFGEDLVRAWQAIRTTRGITAGQRSVEAGQLIREAPSRLHILGAMRSALWESADEVPAIAVWHCESLGPCGRATTRRDGMRVIAVSLAQPTQHVVLQILHEDIHALTDPAVFATSSAMLRSTACDEPGYLLHAAAEDTAIEVGRALIAARFPDWQDAYDTWCASWSVPHAHGQH